MKLRMMTPGLLTRMPIVTEDELFERAVAARQRAYARYSHFRVGAALEDESGAIHVGCNVENAAYPVGICAEASAISAMCVAGGRRIRRIAVVGGLADGLETVFCAPCGACRQRIAEFSDATTLVLLRDGFGHVRRFDLSSLLPAAFGPMDVLPAPPASG